jgi:hypothetical protein
VLSSVLPSLRALPLIFKLFRNLIYGSFNPEVNFYTSWPRTQVILNHTHEQALLIYKIVVFQKLFPYGTNQINRKRFTYKLLFSLPPHTTHNCINGPKQLSTSEVRFRLKCIRQILRYKEKYATFQLNRVSHWIPSSHFLPKPCYLKHKSLTQTLFLIEKYDSAPRGLTLPPARLSSVAGITWTPINAAAFLELEYDVETLYLIFL